MAAALFATSAEAARLHHPSATSKAAEKGVSVWRGPKPAAPAPAEEKLAGGEAARCGNQKTVFVAAAFPARRARTHGFWSGDGPDRELRYGIETHGFFADRMRAGL